MNKTLIFRKIGGIISEISEQYQYLAADPENINPLELELFVANSHFLSEHLAILKKLYSDPDVSNAPHLPRHFQVQEPQLSMTIPALESDDRPAELNILEPADSFSPEIVVHQPEEVNQTMTLEDNSRILLDEADKTETLSPPFAKDVSTPTKETIELPASFLSEPEAGPALETAKEVIETRNEPVSVVPVSTDDRVPTLNEVLSAGKKIETVVSTINQSQEKDLKSMIKLNDKLMFVRDLFNGYSLAYSEAIDFINRFDSFEAADKFLKHNYADKNRWSEKQSSVDQFYEVLSRRFS